MMGHLSSTCWRFAVLAVLALSFCGGCGSPGRAAYSKGMGLLQAQDYAGALVQFDKALAAEPELVMPVYRRARCLYQLKRYDEALTAYESFLAKTESDKTTYSGERNDAAFYRDKCKQELGQEVPQDPAAIPPPPMGE